VSRDGTVATDLLDARSLAYSACSRMRRRCSSSSSCGSLRGSGSFGILSVEDGLVHAFRGWVGASAAGAGVGQHSTGYYTRCINTGVSEDGYKRALQDALRELAELGRRSAQIDERRAQLVQTIGHLSRLCGVKPNVPWGITDA
jgi:hypothetical protein